MMERIALYERFQTLTWQQQLGNLASTLAKISTQSTQKVYDELTSQLLREATLMIEWCATNVPQNFCLELAGMQKELLAWKKIFPMEQTRNLLSLHTRSQSNRVLQMAGLLRVEEKFSPSNYTKQLSITQNIS